MGDDDISLRDRLWTGYVWDNSSAHQCEVLYMLGVGYRTGPHSNFGDLKWAEVGEATQIEIARALKKLNDLLKKAARSI